MMLGSAQAKTEKRTIHLPATVRPVMAAISAPAPDATRVTDFEILRRLAHAPRPFKASAPRMTLPQSLARVLPPRSRVVAPGRVRTLPTVPSVVTPTVVAPPRIAPVLLAAVAAAPVVAAPVVAAPPAAAPGTTTVAPAPTPPPAPLAAASTPVAPPIARDADGVPLVTNYFVETDLKQALSDISAQTGVAIIADNTVQGAITADLKDVPLPLALDMLLQTGGFTLVKRDGYYLVGMPDPSNPNFYLLSQTEVVELNHVAPRVVLDLLAIPYGRYLSAENFAPTITEPGREGGNQSYVRRSVGLGGGGTSSPQRLGVSSPSINQPPESDKISITAPELLRERIKADIKRLDQPRTQVVLEAVVLEISEEALKEVGLDFTTRFLSGSLLSGAANITYSAIGGDESARLTALVRDGTARLRANPRVATAEGQTAEIEVGRENYFEIDTGNNNLSYATLEVIKSGILLRITPKVLESSNEVMARIEPEVRDVTGRSSNGLPEITFRRAATNMRVRDGQSIVIGGLINEFTNVTKSKVPILGDIPILGKIFRGTNSRKVKTEVVIIITPHILKDDVAPDRVRDSVLQNDLDVYRKDEPWEPFAFPPRKKK